MPVMCQTLFYLFNKHSLSAYYVPRMALGTEGPTVRNKIRQPSFSPSNGAVGDKVLTK